jgi:hypothetical protein
MKKVKVQYLAFLIVLILSFLVMLPAEAYTCRNYKGHQICILSIKRSAKNHWEYRASVSVDGVKTPVEVYNCRDGQRPLLTEDQIRNQHDTPAESLRHRKVMPFGKDDASKVICSFFKKVS